MKFSRTSQWWVAAIVLGIAGIIWYQHGRIEAQCPEQALKLFDNLGYGTDHYEPSHQFNAELRKCFLIVKGAQKEPNGMGMTYSLYDAFEGKEYGNLFLVVPSDRSGVRIVNCMVLNSYGDQTKCRSSEDFHSLTRAYVK